MIVDAQVRMSLETRYAFPEWNGQTRLDDDLFIWKFFMNGEEFGGWKPHYVRFVAPDEDTPWPHVAATLVAAGEGPQAVLNVEVYECASRLAAHDFLLESLAGFDLPRVERVEGQGIGDVAFGTPTRTVILFARANLVVFVKNSSREAVNVEPFARALDGYLIAEPPEAETVEALAPQIEVPESMPETPPTPETPLPLRIRADEPGRSRVWFKFFSRSGSVRQKEGAAFYRAGESAAGEAESHSFRVYAVAPGEGVGALTVSLGPE